MTKEIDIINYMRPKLTHNEFMYRMKSVNNGLTILDKYNGFLIRLKVIDKLGIIYKVRPSRLLAGTIPTIRSAINKSKYFAIKATEKHKNKYDYSFVEYKNNITPVKILCPIHGIFEQRPDNHLQGEGCIECGREAMKKNRPENGFSLNSWINFCKNRKDSEPKLYIIRCYNDNEEFIKIGITSRPIYERFKNSQRMPYEYEVIKEIKGSPKFVFKLEKSLHKRFNSYKYVPELEFEGKGECFDININNIINILI